jgi:hypothetical protein
MTLLALNKDRSFPALVNLTAELDAALEDFNDLNAHGDSYSTLQAYRRIDSVALAIAATPITGPDSLQLLASATCRYLGKPPNERDLDSCGIVGRVMAAACIAGALALAPGASAAAT